MSSQMSNENIKITTALESLVRDTIKSEQEGNAFGPNEDIDINVKELGNMDAIRQTISEIGQTLTEKGQGEREGHGNGKSVGTANGVITEMDPEVEKIIDNLVHASKCKNKNCCMPTCKNMKMIYRHVQICKKGAGPRGCQTCWRVVVLSYHHSSFCQKAECPAYFCFNLKDYMKKEKIMRKLKRIQKKMDRRYKKILALRTVE